MDKKRPHALLLRKANLKDSAPLLRWRNDPATRKNSFSTRKVSRAEHRAWFTAALTSKSRVLLIALKDSRKRLGMVRYDFTAPQAAEVNINLAPEERGKGWGAKILRKGNAWLKKNRKIKNVTAKIKKQNTASKRAFEAADYRFIRRTASFDLYGVKL